MGVRRYKEDTFLEVKDLLKEIGARDNQIPLIAEAMCKQYCDDTASEIINNPYCVTWFGVGFRYAERIAASRVDRRGIWRYKEPFRQSDRRRVKALVRAAYMRMTVESGSTVCSLKDVVQMAWELESWAGVFGDRTAPLYMSNEIYHMSRVMDDDGEIMLVMDDLNEAETTIARRVKDLRKVKTGIAVNDAMIDVVQDELGIVYDEDQRKAFELLKSGIGILTGGPGTGKTTTLKGLLMMWECLKDGPIMLCAPSNTAKARMTEACGVEAETIHTMLGIRPFIPKSKDRATLDLPHGCLVVCDEFSMVDTKIAATLLSSVVKAKGSILLVGDENQLESVEPGSVLRDLIAWGKVPMTRLHTIHRQMNDASIIAVNAQKVLEGDKSLEIDEIRFGVWRRNRIDDLLDDVVLWYTSIMARKDWGLEPLDVRIFSPVKKRDYNTSIYRINTRLHEYYHADDPDAYHCNGYNISAGEPVIVMENNAELGIYNGDLGVAERTSPDEIDIRIGGQVVTVTRRDAEVALAYACTVHKGQGGECKVALVVLTNEARHMITRRLLYVGMTRATHRLAIMTQPWVLEAAIDNTAGKSRRTGLVSKLKGRR